jgi:hypothetical protein
MGAAAVRVIVSAGVPVKRDVPFHNLTHATGMKIDLMCAKICMSGSAKVVRELRKIVGHPPDKCELCGRVEALHLDQDHATKEFRGWLCRSCNTSLGGLGDNVDGLRRAIAYLERSRSGASSSRASPY